jgi:hypothetical protein
MAGDELITREDHPGNTTHNFFYGWYYSARFATLATCRAPLRCPKKSGPQELADRGERQKAVDGMMQFAAKHGFTTGGQDLKSMVHEGHKY